jgi:hypothetical protein
MTKDELFDKISQISGFLVGYGDVAELAADRLRRLMDEIDAVGLAACDPEPSA